MLFLSAFNLCDVEFTTGGSLSIFVTVYVFCVVSSETFITSTVYVPFFVTAYLFKFVLCSPFHEYGFSGKPILSVAFAVKITSWFVSAVVLAVNVTSGGDESNVIFA